MEKKYSIKTTLLCVLMLCLSSTSFLLKAQFSTPNVNATIAPNEYGTGNVNKHITNLGNTNWYMTWDNDFLYVAVDGANENEAGILYLDINPLIPVNGGTSANGELFGYTYSGLGAHNLPFRGDVVLYFSKGTREIRKFSSGLWGQTATGSGAFGGGLDDESGLEIFYASDNKGNGAGSDDIREFKISWLTLTGSLPSSFNWFGYMARTNETYALAPKENPAVNTLANSVLDFNYYFTVSTTGNGTSTNPTSRISYTHIGNDIASFPDINVWDFTMNSSGKTITRSSTANWDIKGNLVIHDGTIDLNSSSTGYCKVEGDVQIGGTGTFSLNGVVNAGNLQLKGNFLNQGTFNPNTKAVIFEGTVKQTIGGGVGTTFAKIIINKPSGDVNLNDFINVTDFVQLISGDLDLSDDVDNSGTIDSFEQFVLQLGSAAYLIEDRINNHLVTDKATNLSETNVGGSVYISGVSITNTSNNIDIGGMGVFMWTTQAIDNYTSGDIIRYHYPISNLGTNKKNVRKVFDITAPAILTHLAFEYAADEKPSGATINKVYHYNGITLTWEEFPATSTPNGTVTYIELDLPTSTFSPWTTGGSTGSLPITLLNFEAQKINSNQVKLTWSTANELNNKGFEIQKSTDGVDFQMIGFVDGAGNSNSIKNYQFNDVNLSESAYYRLKQIDFDNSFALSAVRFVEGIRDFSFYPNPVQNKINLALPIDANAVTNIQITNLQGKIIFQQRDNLLNVQNALNAQLKNFSQGTYIVKINTAQKVYTNKFVKY